MKFILPSADFRLPQNANSHVRSSEQLNTYSAYSSSLTDLSQSVSIATCDMSSSNALWGRRVIFGRERLSVLFLAQATPHLGTFRERHDVFLLLLDSAKGSGCLALAHGSALGLIS